MGFRAPAPIGPGGRSHPKGGDPARRGPRGAPTLRWPADGFRGFIGCSVRRAAAHCPHEERCDPANHEVGIAKSLHPTDWARYGTRLAGTWRKRHASTAPLFDGFVWGWEALGLAPRGTTRRMLIDGCGVDGLHVLWEPDEGWGAGCPPPTAGSLKPCGRPAGSTKRLPKGASPPNPHVVRPSPGD
jgi:hypothetical protein